MTERENGRRLLDRVRRIAALAQNGLAYTEGVFDRERYEELREIAAAMLAESADVAVSEIHGMLAAESGYSTPKVDVRGVVFREDRLLLVREIEDGRWTLPGGWADSGLSVREAVEKEILEESGFQARAVKLLAVHERDRHTTVALPWAVYKFFVRCEITGGAARPSVETSEVGFFAEDALPPLSEGRVTAAQLRSIFEHLRDPHRPADFD